MNDKTKRVFNGWPTMVMGPVAVGGAVLQDQS